MGFFDQIWHTDGGKIAIVSLVGVIFAAVVAGLSTLLAACLNRKSAKFAAEISRGNAILQARLTANVKLAEFRQQWIDALREDMAKFSSLCIILNITERLENNLEVQKISIADAVAASQKIILRINRNDENFVALDQLIYKLTPSCNAENLQDLLHEYNEICQKILKAEWDVLRDEVRGVCD